MKGTLKQRSKGSWSIVVDVGRDPTTGKRRQQRFTVRGTKKQADSKLVEILHSLENGGFVKPAKETVSQFLDRWLKEYAWPNLAPSTAEGYEHIVKRHLTPALGNIPLSQLRPEMLQAYYKDKLKIGRIDGKGGLNGQSVRHHHVTLHTALEFAVKWGLLVRNPADATDPPNPDPREMHTFDEVGLRTFLAAARETPYYSLFYTALFSGLRRSEMLGLRWKDVDLNMAQISVNRTLHKLRDGSIVFRQPKTAKSRRLVDLPPSAAIVLRQHKENQEAVASILGLKPQDNDLVFASQDGKPMLPNTVTHAWIKLVRRTGFKGIRLHDSRHSHATILLKKGIHPKIVQERLGHSSITITLDTYSHVLPGLQAAAAKKFEEGLIEEPGIERVIAGKAM